MIKIEKVVPKKDIVIVKLLNVDEAYNELITPNISDEHNIAVRYGEVIAKGPTVDDLEHCPDLQIGEKVIFTEFAGYHIPVESGLYKAIRGYDIIGKFMKEIDVDNNTNIAPTGDRVLVEVVEFTDDETGLFIAANDPRLADLSYGIVLKINHRINKQDLVENQLVAFAPYAGTTIRNYESKDKKELKILVEHDVLFTA